MFACSFSSRKPAEATFLALLSDALVGVPAFLLVLARSREWVYVAGIAV